MDSPMSIELHPSSPKSGLHSPEPSGTPDLRRLSSHRGSAVFGYSHRKFNTVGQTSACFGQQLQTTDSECTATGLLPTNTGMKAMGDWVNQARCSTSVLGSKEMEATVYLTCSKLERNCQEDETDDAFQNNEVNLASPASSLNDLLQDFRIGAENFKSNEQMKGFPSQASTSAPFGLENMGIIIKTARKNEIAGRDTIPTQYQSQDLDPDETSPMQQLPAYNQNFQSEKTFFLKNSRETEFGNAHIVAKHLSVEGSLESKNRIVESGITHHSQASNNLQKSLPPKEELLGGMHAKFLDLVEKVTSLHGNVPSGVSRSISIPPKIHETVGRRTIMELQKKVEDLKIQLIHERHQGNVVAQTLNELRHEKDTLLDQKQALWENKFRGIQKEKHALSMRLQKIEMESPRQRILRGGEVHLTEEELRSLHKEISEQESLIKGYQVENERAIERLKEVQAEAKARELLMAEENANLASQLASLQVSGSQKVSNGCVYTSLSESLTLRAEVEDSKDRQSNLMSEIEKLKNENEILEKKIIELEKTTKIQEESPSTIHEDISTVSCKYVGVALNNSTQYSKFKNCHSLDRGENNHPMNEVFDSLDDKENIFECNKISQVKANENYVKESHAALKKIERIKHEYEIQIRALKQQLQKKSITACQPAESEQAATRKVKDLERQVDEVRSYYIKKVKELTEKLDTSKKEKITECKTNVLTNRKGVTQQSSMVQDLKSTKQRVDLLEAILAEKNAIINSLKAKTVSMTCEQEVSCQLANKTRGKCHMAENTNKETPDVLNCQVYDTAFGKSADSVKKLLTADQINDKECSNIELVKVESLQSLETDKIDPEVLKERSKTTTQAESSLYLQQQEPHRDDLFAAGTRSKSNIQFKAFPQLEDEEWKKSKACEKNKVEKWQPNVYRLEDPHDELEFLQNKSVQSPGLHGQLQILHKKVLEMEARQNQREDEWRKLLLDTKRILTLEHDMAERKLELAMGTKNAEIERFKLELDTILEAAIKIQKTQLKFAHTSDAIPWA